MSRPLPPACAVVHLVIRLCPVHREPKPSRADAALEGAAVRPGNPDRHRPPWTVRRIAEDTGVPPVLVARTARGLGFQDLVFDDDEAAAIRAALHGTPPPRAA